jgi:AbrB family looped-hinge helix DNA binding protein
MKIGERGQVTIPKEIRDEYGLGPKTEVEFQVEAGKIVLRKVGRRLDLERWKGYCADSFRELGFDTVDEFIREIRGR